MTTTTPCIVTYIEQLYFYSLDNTLLPTSLFLTTCLATDELIREQQTFLLSFCNLFLSHLGFTAEVMYIWYD